MSPGAACPPSSARAGLHLVNDEQLHVAKDLRQVRDGLGQLVDLLLAAVDQLDLLVDLRDLVVVKALSHARTRCTGCHAR